MLGYMSHCLALCGACGKPICFTAINRDPRKYDSPTQIQGDIDATFMVQETWPQRRQSIAPSHTPPAVARRFVEAEDGFKRGHWNSAVAMYRSALDIATKAMDGVPADKTFFQRLKWLHENHRITPEIRSWADHVRVEGNDALHEPDEFTQEDATPLRFFTEMFLRYVFELPGEVRKFREPSEATDTVATT